MSAAWRRDAWLPFLPLVLASAALGAREATRSVEPAVLVEGRAHAFVVPPAVLAAVKPALEDRAYTVDARHSRGVWTREEGARAMSSSRVSGRLILRPDGSLAQLELRVGFSGSFGDDFGDTDDAEPGLDSTLTQTGPALCHHSDVPNSCTGRIALRTRVHGEPRDLTLDAAWMRLPGGSLRLQGLAALDGELADARRTDEPARGDASPATLALDLALVPER